MRHEASETSSAVAGQRCGRQLLIHARGERGVESAHVNRERSTRNKPCRDFSSGPEGRTMETLLLDTHFLQPSHPQHTGPEGGVKG